MVVMPLLWASFSIAAPEAESRLTIMRTLMPLLSMPSAMVFIFAASFCAFWMSQLRLTFVHSAFIASGLDRISSVSKMLSIRSRETRKATVSPRRQMVTGFFDRSSRGNWACASVTLSVVFTATMRTTH